MPPDDSSRPPDNPSGVDRFAAAEFLQKSQQAASATPRQGSVTQSNNTDGDAVTLDKATITFEEGEMILEVKEGSGTRWSVSSGDDKGGYLRSTDEFTGRTVRDFWIDKMLDDDSTLFVLAHTSKLGTEGLHDDAREFIRGETIQSSQLPSWISDEFDSGSTAIGLYDRFSETTDGRETDVYVPDEAGGTYLECVSADTGECKLSSNGLVTKGTILLRDGGRPTIVKSWDAMDMEHLNLGYWMRLPAGAENLSQVLEVGVFFDGGNEFDFSQASGSLGQATYKGPSDALVTTGSTPFFESVSGKVALTADFDQNAIGGAVTLIPNELNEDTFLPGNIVLRLEDASIDRSLSGGFFTGNTSSHTDSSISGLTGKWGGQFHGPADTENGGVPKYAGGTYGAQNDDYAILGSYFSPLDVTGD